MSYNNSSSRKSCSRQTARSYPIHRRKDKATNCTTDDILHTLEHIRYDKLAQTAKNKQLKDIRLKTVVFSLSRLI